ncbi:hypothetical protein CLOM_g21052 [Closterium sp. NIES-68]|nr:hypothetical protein CLOM_g21052 [Closterium sp. NIES-68]GJP62581.1 hypothetical protein CLOP_g19628 [Closterium sp. NIES-67]
MPSLPNLAARLGTPNLLASLITRHGGCSLPAVSIQARHPNQTRRSKYRSSLSSQQAPVHPVSIKAHSLPSSIQSATTDPSAHLSSAHPPPSPLPPAPLSCPCAICSRRALISASLLLSASALPANAADSASSAASASAQTAEAAQAALAAIRGGKWRWQEELFAWMMATGMKEYEESVEGYKTALFEPLRAGIGRIAAAGGAGGGGGGGGESSAEGMGVSGKEGVFRVVEIGVGAGPNFRFYTPSSESSPNISSSLQTQSAPAFEIVGVDPNPSMQPYAEASAAASGLAGNQFRFLQGVGEALPLDDGCADVAVCSLVMCSVADVRQCVSEIKRILKPGGSYYFLEHVAAPQGTSLHTWQRILDPLQAALADGCHLTRSPLTAIKLSGFGAVQAREVMVPGLSLLAPHVMGTAVKA